MTFLLKMLDGTTDRVDGVDGYGQEGPLTTFFRSEPGRPVRLDPWCTRVVSVRTDRVLRISSADQHDTHLSLVS